MVNKLQLTHPTLIMLYGYPGSGKTYFARQLCEEFQAAHVQGDRIRHELFDEPRYDKQENAVITQLMKYMSEEFLSAGISVVFDVNATRTNQRRDLRELARTNKAKTLLIWFQIDEDSAFARISTRDRRKSDDKYSQTLDRKAFDSQLETMQNPTINDDYIVISGKHTFNTQRGAVIKKLYDLGLLHSEHANSGIAKPALVNLVPNTLGGRVDPSRRNITIR